MIHVRLIVPTDLVPEVLEILRAAPEVTNLWHLPNAAYKPAGDLISCDCAKEEASTVLDRLTELGLETRGSIAIENVDASISSHAEEAERAAPGLPADAIVWEEVSSRVSESATLSWSYLIFITVATLIGAIGIITDSIVLIIGAMIVGPEYGPLAGICVGLVERRPKRALESLKALAFGFPIAILASALLTLVLLQSDLAPDVLHPAEHELTLFIARPNWYSVIVALLAGVAGMLALVSAKSGALLGVLVSVTTIPAASNVGVAAAYEAWGDAGRAAAQLGINLSAIVVSGAIVLLIARRFRERRRKRSF